MHRIPFLPRLCCQSPEKPCSKLDHSWGFLSLVTRDVCAMHAIPWTQKSCKSWRDTNKNICIAPCSSHCQPLVAWNLFSSPGVCLPATKTPSCVRLAAQFPQLNHQMCRRGPPGTGASAGALVLAQSRGGRCEKWTLALLYGRHVKRENDLQRKLPFQSRNMLFWCYPINQIPQWYWKEFLFIKRRLAEIIKFTPSVIDTRWGG